MAKAELARTWVSLALALSALLGFGNLTSAQEPKSKPAVECVRATEVSSGFYEGNLRLKNICKKYISIKQVGFHNSNLGWGRAGYVPGAQRIARIGPDSKKPSITSPFWIGACSVSFADSPEHWKVVINIDPDAGTYSCGEGGKYGGGKAKTTLDKKTK